MSTTATADPDTSAGTGPARRAIPLYFRLLKPLASLQFTVALFALSVLLVFFGTLAQMDNGIWTVVSKYFWSDFVKVDLQLLVQFAQKFDILGIISKNAQVPGWFPLLGGRLLGFLLLVNLLAAHLVRFKLNWNRLGVIVLHSGLILLFVGEFITREYAVEQKMSIDEGKSTNYAEDTRHVELAFVDGSDSQVDRVVVIPQSLLQGGGRITDPDLPADVQIDKYLVNSDIEELKPKQQNPATAGLGLRFFAKPLDEVSGVATQQTVDLPAAYVTLLRKGSEEKLGTYLVSLEMDVRNLKDVVAIDGKPFDLSLRFARHYKPFSLKLVKFRFDRYVGTNTPKNYSSQLILDDPERGVNREVLIKMNDPLRYRGETYYQADFDKKTEKTTILQVVHNPGWLIPYISCVLVALGMLLHFGMTLGRYLTRASAGLVPRSPLTPTSPETTTTSLSSNRSIGALFRIVFGNEAAVTRLTDRPLSGFERALPWIMVAIAASFLLSKTFGPSSGPLDLAAAGELPVIEGGRVKPLDSVARVRMRIMSSREEFLDDKKQMQPAIRWFFDAASVPNPTRDPGAVATYPLFRIENDQVLNLLGLEPREGYRYSLEEMRRKTEEFDDAVKRAAKRPEKERDLFDHKLLELQQQFVLFFEVLVGETPRLLPPSGERKWRTVKDAKMVAMREAVGAMTEQFPDMRDPDSLPPDQLRVFRQALEQAFAEASTKDPAFAAWEEIIEAYRNKDASRFNRLIVEFRNKQYPELSFHDAWRVRLEAFLNVFAPFYHAITLYILAFLLTIAGWVSLLIRPSLGESLRRAAFGVLLVTFVVHLAALLSRMYLMDRPLVFVTNLYSSAVFIGAGVVGMCLIIERIFPIGLGNAVAAALGAGTCIVAHNLAAAGDTLEMLQAVLDTNFWLATHVTTVTLGYAATYVAWFIGLCYLILGIATPFLDRTLDVGGKPQTLGRVIGTILYGVICFATMLSFVGTVLGGIWADQSWGRFWGWDPKENGAVLIVVWNALILHARWCGLVKDRGVATLALVGNMITTWSWFGTNQLGVGLHAYGFSNTLAAGCAINWVAQLVLIAAALTPSRFWQSTGRLPRNIAKPVG